MRCRCEVIGQILIIVSVILDVDAKIRVDGGKQFGELLDSIIALGGRKFFIKVATQPDDTDSRHGRPEEWGMGIFVEGFRGQMRSVDV